jgi:hypothetical protein
MHSSKLEFWTWTQALYFVATSIKGISSVVLARNLGVTQATAWRLGHSIREKVKSKSGKPRLVTKLVPVEFQFATLVAAGLDGACGRRRITASRPSPHRPRS